MERTTPQQQQGDQRKRPQESPERPPVWMNTSPPANGELDKRDLERGVDRLEAILGR
jgi:hypothetical protein